MNHLRPFALSRIIGVFTVSLFLIANSSILFAQSDAFKNGSFETQTNGHPDGWYFPAILSESGITMSLDSATPFEGNQSALVDTTKLDAADPRTFGMLNQILDPKNFQGKRVRFRAAVKTAERTNEGRAQLWLRVDRKPETGQRGSIGAFDNMQDRPITVDDWQNFEIVADIEEDAVRLTVGMLVMGKTKAWIDGASLEIVDEEVTTTAKKIPDYSIADKAPPQSFFNAWLWLAMIAIFFFLFSQTKNNLVQRFALRFSFVYWLLYSFPSPFTDIIGSLLATLAKLNVPIEAVGKSFKTFSDGYDHYVEQVVHWVAQNGLGIEGDLILPNGSGDTTFAFVRLLVYFGTAFCVALIWSGVFYKRNTDQAWLRDMLQTYLRYVLAFTMLGYGLAKAGFIQTQFATAGSPSEFQLDRTYGASSPMGLLWTFMAASPMYTFFAGLGETIGGLLLVFRRTATLGAIVVFGVMLNVVMLNFCYDVPVKQYSFHLVLMSVIVLMPDVPRLFNVLLLNRPTEKKETYDPPYTNSKTVWGYRILKAMIIVCAFGVPVFNHTLKEVRHEHPEQVESKHLLMNRGFRWINEYPFNR